MLRWRSKRSVGHVGMNKYDIISDGSGRHDNIRPRNNQMAPGRNEWANRVIENTYAKIIGHLFARQEDEVKAHASVGCN